MAPLDRAVLVGTEVHGNPGLLPVEASLDELAQLARTAGIEVVGRAVQRLRRIHPATYVGPGKVEEIQALVRAMRANMVIFDDELSPSQQRNLENAFGDNIRVLDRTALILDIFAQHAHTREGALQVELAQYEYRLPRLTRRWQDLAQQAGGSFGRGGISGVGLRGPGEKQLEIDRRRIRERIARLKEELETVRAHRQRYRERRRRAQVPVVVLVGYTNAGKSTLLNAVSGSNVLVADQLFATLDPTTRRVKLPEGGIALFTDTVGFIQKLPHQLVAAFRATLEEINEADLILHVLDITHPNALQQARVVIQTLREIGVGDIPMITALNKIDRLPDPAAAQTIAAEHFDFVAISAAYGIGLEDLLRKVEAILYRSLTPVRVRLPLSRGDLVALFYHQGVVEWEAHTDNEVTLFGRLPGRLLTAFRVYLDHGEIEVLPRYSLERQPRERTSPPV
ncbi:MAG: GTPase HflX [Anaerolineae bacterium]|nr:GTPase HflX [Thermoflexus sp.]MDW8064215.1 GTPase HflX [Anaerolineae bacterium]